MSATQVTVTATFNASPGRSQSQASLQWQLSATMFDAAGLVICTTQPIPFPLNAAGHGSAVLWAVDDPTSQPQGLFWTLSGTIGRQPFSQSYAISYVASPVDIASLTQAQPTVPFTSYAAQAVVTAEVARAEAAEALSVHLAGSETITGAKTTSVATLPAQTLNTPSSVAGSTGATSQGYRTAAVSLLDMVDTVDTAVISIDQIQLTNPGSATIKKTGIHCKSFTMPDNGGDTSAGLFVQTGGGGACTAYKVSSLRPAGYADYSSSAQGGLEAATGDKSQAIIAIAGVFESTFHTNYRSDAVYARVDNASSGAFLASPGDGSFDTRLAFAVGNKQSNAVPTGQTFSVTMAGALVASQGKMLGAGQNTFTPTTASGLGGAMVLQDSAGATASGGFLVLGAQQGLFCGIKALLTNGGTNTIGDMAFLTRNAVGDSTLTERFRLKAGGGAQFNGSGLVVENSGHIVGSNVGAVATTIANGAGIGSGPGAPTISGTDIAGHVVINTGTGPSVDGIAVTISFAFAWSATPRSIVLSAGDSGFYTCQPSVLPADIGTGSWSIRLHNPSASTAYTIYYTVTG